MFHYTNCIIQTASIVTEHSHIDCEYSETTFIRSAPLLPDEKSLLDFTQQDDVDLYNQYILSDDDLAENESFYSTHSSIQSSQISFDFVYGKEVVK